MAEIGDDALAAGIELVPGTAPASAIDEWINKLADELARRTMAVMSIAKGGTGQTTAEGARNALEVVSKVGAGDIRILNIGGGRIQFEIPGYADPTTLAHVADVNYIADTHIAKTGGTMTGNLDVPNIGISGSIFNGGMNPVVSGYVAVYRDASGRIGIAASTRRAKKNIAAWTPNLQALLALEVVTFHYRAALFDKADPLRTDPPLEVGLIAEDLVALGLDWLVYFDADGLPAGVHYERLALALVPLVQDHEARLTALEARP